MTKLEAIEEQIKALSPRELAELGEWLLEHDWAEWDGQIERDSDAGKIEELRFRTVGYTATERLVLVAHTDRDDRIRIISGRDATPPERRQYEQQT